MVDASTSPRASRAAADQIGPVLVVGGAGYIGSHMVRLLAREGVACAVFDDLSTGHREAVGDAPLHVASLADRDALSRVFAEVSPRCVIHFAAKSYVGESVERPAFYWRENVVNTWNLLEAMREHGCDRIVFSSTCATFGVPGKLPIEDDAPQAPITAYGRSKLAIEHMLDDYAIAYDLRYAALRYFNAAGAHHDGDLGEDHDPETHLIPLVLDVAAGRRDEILIFGDDYSTPDGTCIRDYIHVEDLATVHLEAAAVLARGPVRLRCNLGTGTGYSVREIVEAARKVTGHAIPARVVARRSGDPPELVSGGERAKRELGFAPARSDVETIVRDAWGFKQTHPDGYGRDASG